MKSGNTLMEICIVTFRGILRVIYFAVVGED